MISLLASIPSPPGKGIHIGPLQLRAYGLMIALGVIVAAKWSDRRWEARTGTPSVVSSLAVWAVPAGVIGARLYHVITDYEIYTHHVLKAFAIWDGGLGIPGGIAAGVGTGLIVARRRGLALRLLLDVVAPALPLAQSIGRWGNWFNQELFGRPSTLPWAVRIDVANRPAGFERFTTFQPTFLYESLWNLAVVGVVLLVERRRRLRSGRLFAVYIAGYAAGRFAVERMRIDFAHTIAGLRVNEWISILAFAVAIGFVVTGRVDPAVPDLDPWDTHP
ncbi:MAG: prolipoprotein diacylglyceryl transferase, partial [Ilumatobacteraceae bacterium]|nr:prolipoprotein diacylglyceryl transferase [Ilumatobacteraceae bacterium]